jgi:hypothetical protein
MVQANAIATLRSLSNGVRSIRSLLLMRNGKAVVFFTIRPLMVTALLSLTIFTVATTGTLTAHAQDRLPGLTGADRPDDVVMARQLLMSGIEDEMMAIEVATEAKEFQLNDLKPHAYVISTLLTAFPHLFPPQTKPSASRDVSPSATSTTLAI